MLKESRHDGSFIARDENGVEYIIDMFTDILDNSSFEDPKATKEGRSHLRTREGGGVNYIDEGKYEITQGKVIVTSDDPGAP